MLPLIGVMLEVRFVLDLKAMIRYTGHNAPFGQADQWLHLEGFVKPWEEHAKTLHRYELHSDDPMFYSNYAATAWAFEQPLSGVSAVFEAWKSAARWRERDNQPYTLSTNHFIPWGEVKGVYLYAEHGPALRVLPLDTNVANVVNWYDDCARAWGCYDTNKLNTSGDVARPTLDG